MSKEHEKLRGATSHEFTACERYEDALVELNMEIAKELHAQRNWTTVSKGRYTSIPRNALLDRCAMLRDQLREAVNETDKATRELEIIEEAEERDREAQAKEEVK
ncbi:MAG: hypothetical protein WC551_13615 [Patescibacteria group bacterium]